MATDLHNEQAPSVTRLVAGIAQDAQELLKQEFQLLKSEVRADVHKVKVGAQVLGLGAALGLVGGVLLAVALTYWLQNAWPNLPLWGCFAIVGGGLLALGGAIYVGGWLQLHQPVEIEDRDVFGLQKR